jgi:hypothetical protein
MSSLMERAKHHQEYMQHKQQILAKERTWRKQHKQQIKMEQRQYRMRVKMGLQRPRHRVRVGSSYMFQGTSMPKPHTGHHHGK